MAKGKQTCKILKEIRKQIAAENDIELVISECTYQGDCLGTCPKCEAEVRYLERELEKRQRLGKAAVFAGMSLGTLFASTGCHIIQPLAGMPMDPSDGTEVLEKDTIPEQPLAGDVVANVPVQQFRPSDTIDGQLMGKMPLHHLTYGFDDEYYQNFMKDKFVFSAMKGLSVVGGLVEYEHVGRGKACNTMDQLVEETDEFKAPYYEGGEKKFCVALAAELMDRLNMNKYNGEMEVAFTVGQTGDVDEVKVLKGVDEALDAAVAAALAQMTWEPATYKLKDGSRTMPFACRCVKKIHFPMK